MIKKAFILILGCFALCVTGCGENGGNGGGESVDKFVVPQYTEGGDCNGITQLCDGNIAVSCVNGKITVEDCKDWDCVWVPDALMAYCEDGELEECKTPGEKHTTCWDAYMVIDEKYPATLTQEHCYETNLGKYYIIDDEDLYCKGDCKSSTTCNTVEDD